MQHVPGSGELPPPRQKNPRRIATNGSHKPSAARGVELVPLCRARAPLPQRATLATGKVPAPLLHSKRPFPSGCQTWRRKIITAQEKRCGDHQIKEGKSTVCSHPEEDPASARAGAQVPSAHA